MTEWLHFHFSLSCIEEGNGNLLQYSCLENPRDGAAWWAAVYGVTQSRTLLKRLSSSSIFIIYVFILYYICFILYMFIIYVYIFIYVFDFSNTFWTEEDVKCFSLLLYQVPNNCFQWLDHILLSFINYIIRYLSSFSHSINNIMKSMLMHKGFIYFTFYLRLEHCHVLNSKREKKSTCSFLIGPSRLPFFLRHSPWTSSQSSICLFLCSHLKEETLPNWALFQALFTLMLALEDCLGVCFSLRGSKLQWKEHESTCHSFLCHTQP